MGYHEIILSDSMVKSIIVDVKEILNKDKNPTICLSPLRYLGKCIECERFKQELRKNNFDIELVIKKMKCKPIVSKEQINAFKEKKMLLDKLRKVEKRIKELR